MKREAKVKPRVEGKGLRPKRAHDTDSSRRQSGDPGADRAGPPALLLTWPHTCRAKTRRPNQSRPGRLRLPSLPGAPIQSRDLGKLAWPHE